jgi:DNA-binding NarL/FixJ family response regulator
MKLEFKDGCLVISIQKNSLLRILMKQKQEDDPYELTVRENQVLQGVLKHQANKEIAAELHLSERTVKFHVSALLRKLKCATRMDVERKFRTKEKQK